MAYGTVVPPNIFPQGTSLASPLTGGPGPGTSYSETSSTGTPTPIATPQSDYQLALAQAIANHGNKQYSWAQNQANYLQGLANEAIPQYLTGAAQAYQMGTNLDQLYNQTYIPSMQQFSNLANTYASAPRQAFAMGQAEAGATQAADQEWKNTQQQLQSMGIDPSSGMYAGLKSAANTAAGASAAGAGNQARQAVENTGIGLQEQNIGFGSNVLSGSLGAFNTSQQGLAGAVNAGESATNTATNAFAGANDFYKTAMGLQNEAVGNGSQSTSASFTQGKVPTFTPSGNSGFGGQALTTVGFAGAQGGEIPDSEGHLEGGLPDSYRRGGHVRRGGGGGRAGGLPTGGRGGAPRQPGFGGNTGYTTLDSDAQIAARAKMGGTGFNTVDSDAEIRARSGGGQSSQQVPPAQGGSNPLATPRPARPARGGGIALNDAGLSDQDTQLGSGPPMDPSMGAARGGSMEPLGHEGRPHPPHPYHVNGLPDASTGGHVPYELSPSHGHTTDDVVANLDAGEFVFPRRTVHHLGHKALYKLIADSDKEMGLHPQPVGAKPVKPGSGAEKARDAATGQNFLNGGGI